MHDITVREIKIYLTLFAAAALAMTSCSKNEVIETQAQDAIGFGTYVGNSPMVKAASADDLNALKKETRGFGVFAFWGDGNSAWTAAAPTTALMTNTQITWQINVWNYVNAGDTKYWSTVDTDKYSFFAYAPWVTGTTMSAGKLAVSKTVYTEEDTDVLVAVKQVDVARSAFRNGDNNTDKKVAFNFKHAKAKLAVKATLSDAVTTAGSNPTLTVSQITIGNIYSSGKVSLELAADNTTTDPATINKVQWSDQSEATRTLTYTLTDNNNSDTHLLIPANYSDLPITVTYTLVQGGVTYSNQTAKGTLSYNFEGSTSYVLTVKVDLNAIEFDVTSVEEWVTANDVNGSAIAE